MEIACDESGYEGEKLIGTTTAAFAHASVALDVATAADCMRELRDRIRSPAEEYKANHVLRQKHRRVLTWVLGPAGPLFGRTHVFLIDKAFYVVDRIVGLLVPDAPDLARTLHRDCREEPGWAAFLVAANNVMRTRGRRDPAESAAEFVKAVAALPEIAHVLRGDVMNLPSADPLIPSIVHAVAYWSRGEPVSIVHDRQIMLTEERITELKTRCDGRLAGVRLAESAWEPRIQVADVLAGVARRIASDALLGRGDPELRSLLGPYTGTGNSLADQSDVLLN